jgi:methyl-accepting chemotaxis protein
MMWKRTALRAVPEPKPAPELAFEPASQPIGDQRNAAEELLGRWLELSELERRAFIVMARELTDSSAIVEHSAIDLSERFKTLAENARAQMARVEAVITAARTIDAGDRAITLSEATGFIEEVLVKVIDTVLAVSKNAMRMVNSLDDVGVEVRAADKCVAQLQAINQQTRFLALNAAIEATRAGKHAGPFEVIAREIRELSNETDNTVKTVNDRITSISTSVRHSHDLLQEIATVDMSEHVTAKKQLDALLTGMIAQNADFNAILSETAGASAELSATIAPLVMGLQFQDRTAQRLAHVIEALGTLSDAGEALRQDTQQATNGTFAPGEIDQVLLARLVDKQTLGEVRKRFLAQLIHDTPADEADAAPPNDHAATDHAATAGGDIDLF